MRQELQFTVLLWEKLKVYSFANVIAKAALSPQLFEDPECWSSQESNLWPPAWQPDAQRTEPLVCVLWGALLSIIVCRILALENKVIINQFIIIFNAPIRAKCSLKCIFIKFKNLYTNNILEKNYLMLIGWEQCGASVTQCKINKLNVI